MDNKRNMETLIPTNECQTAVTQTLLDGLEAEVRERLLELVQQVPLIRNLVSPVRQRAKDRPRDNEGRIIVDLTNPHILENMDYFRQVAIHYNETGRLTDLKPSNDPGSPYVKWLKEETRRIWNGYVRKSDGEWVTGYMYWYLNYCPIMLSRMKEGGKRADRVEAMPEMWEGIYWRFHYIEQASKAGKHCAELASRGKGKAHPYSQTVYTPQGKKLWGRIQVGDCLFGDDGKPTRVIGIPFDGEDDIYTITLKDGRQVRASGEHLWKVYDRRRKRVEVMSTLEMMPIYRQPSAENSDQYDYFFAIPPHKGCEFEEKEVPVDPYALGRMLRKSGQMFTPECYLHNSREIRCALLKGILADDGSLTKNGVTVRGQMPECLVKDVDFLCESLGYKRCNAVITDIELTGREMCKCVTVDNESQCYLIGDLVTTHNSYSLASILSHIFLLGDNQQACRGVTGIVTAASKEYLIKDGILSKFARMIDFCSQKTQFPKRRLKNSLNEMTWKSGYKEVGTDTERGSLNTVIGVTSNDDESKIRGKRAAKILIEEMGCHLKGTKVLMYDGTTKAVEDVKVGELLMGDDQTPRIVEKLFSGRDMMYKLELENGDFQIVNSMHPIYAYCRDKDGTLTRELYSAPKLMQLPYNRYLFIEKAVMHFRKRPYRFEPYDAGALMASKTGVRIFKGRGIPPQYRLNEQAVQLEFIAGFIDFTASETFWGDAYSFNIRGVKLHPELIEDFKFMCEACGLRVKVRKNVQKKWFMTIGGDLSRVPVRKPTLKRPPKEKKYAGQEWNHYRFKVSEYGEGEYYGFTVDKNHLFCLADLQITHNTFPKLLNLYNVLLPSVQEGDVVFGQIYMLGTAGDSESDFSGAREILCNPDGYNMYALKNVYDKEGKGRSKFTFFFPGYVNRKGCYNHDGVSDVIKALIEILRNRYLVRKGSTDPASIMRNISEVPITPDEAMMRNEGNMFPVADCMTRLAELDSNPSAFDDVYVGELNFNTKGEVEFCPTTENPIRDYPLKGNKYTGAVEIFEMPMKDEGNRVYAGRYIASSDPIDTDNADTQSLGSTFVLDLWTDRVVAEYTGRSMYVDDYNETTRKLCLFYSCKLCYENNRKGLFSYFSSHNCSYLLADNLEFLKDKQLAKPGVGNAAKGVSATQAINSYARNLLRSWLVAPIVIQGKDGTETTKARLFTLRTRALLRELVCYNPDGNFDRISSMGMLMLYREEKIILYQGDVQGGQRGRQKGYLGDDPFFSRNYRG